MTQQQTVVTLRYHDIERHGYGCDCGDCDTNGKSYGYAIMDLTEFGVTHTFLLTEAVTDALMHCDPLDVVYGPSEESARVKAMDEMKKQGWKLPDEKPTYDQLKGALQMLVGEEGHCKKECYCHEGLTRNFTMCAVCWAAAAYEATVKSTEIEGGEEGR